MIHPFHFQRQDANPEREHRLAYRESLPGRFESVEDGPKIFLDSESLENQETIRKSDQFKELGHELDEFGRKERYNFLSETSNNRLFHRSVIMGLIMIEAPVKGAPQPVPQSTNQKRTERFIANRGELASFNAIDPDAFKAELGTGIPAIKATAEGYGLDMDRVETLFTAEKAVPTTATEEDLLRNAVFDAWLEVFLLDLAKLNAEEGKEPDVNKLFNTPDEGDGSYLSLQITIERYRQVLDEIYDVFGSPPNGAAVFHNKLSENQQARLIRDVWYGSANDLKKTVRALGPQLGPERTLDTIESLNIYFLNAQGEALDRIPKPSKWGDNIAEAQTAAKYILDIELDAISINKYSNKDINIINGFVKDDPNITIAQFIALPNKGVVPDQRMIAAATANPNAKLSEYLQNSELSSALFESLPPEFVDQLKAFTTGTPPLSADQKQALVRVLGLLGNKLKNPNTLGVSSAGSLSLGFLKPSPLPNLNIAQSMIRRIESPIENVRQSLGLNSEDAAALSTAYRAANLPIEQSAETWRSNPGAALIFLESLNIDNTGDAANPSKAPVAKLYRKLNKKFIPDLRALVNGNDLSKKGEILAILTALSTDLVTRDEIRKRSAQQREELSVLAAMGGAVGEGWEDFKELARNNPIAALILGVVLFKIGRGILFSDKNGAKLARMTIGGGIASLWLIEKYNVLGLKDTVDNRLRGDRFEGTLERFYAQQLLDEKGERVVEDRDDLKHRAIANIGQTPTGELLDFYQDVKTTRIGSTSNANRKGNIFKRLRFPRAMKGLKNTTTYDLDNQEMVDIYTPILEAMFVRYSVERGGPKEGSGARPSTGGYESRIADGYTKLRDDIEGVGLLFEDLPLSRGNTMKAYIMISRHPGDYQKEDRAFQKALDDVENGNLDADLINKDGMYPGEDLYEMALTEVEDTTWKGDMLRRLDSIEDRASYFRTNNFGRNVPFNVILEFIRNPNKIDSRPQPERKSFRDHLRRTKQAGNIAERFYNNPFEEASVVAASAFNSASVAAANSADFVVTKGGEVLTAGGNLVTATGTFLGNAGTSIKQGIEDAGSAIASGYKWTGEKIYNASIDISLINADPDIVAKFEAKMKEVEDLKHNGDEIGFYVDAIDGGETVVINLGQHSLFMKMKDFLDKPANDHLDEWIDKLADARLTELEVSINAIASAVGNYIVKKDPADATKAIYHSVGNDEASSSIMDVLLTDPETIIKQYEKWQRDLAAADPRAQATKDALNY